MIVKIKRIFEVIKNVIDHFDERHTGEPFNSYLIHDVTIDGNILTIRIENDKIDSHRDSILVALKRDHKDEQHNF